MLSSQENYLSMIWTQQFDLDLLFDDLLLTVAFKKILFIFLLFQDP